MVRVLKRRQAEIDRFSAVLVLAVLAACGGPPPAPGPAEPTGPLVGSPEAATDAGPPTVSSTDNPVPTPAVSATPYPGSLTEPFALGTAAVWDTADSPALRIEIVEAYRGYAARQKILGSGAAGPSAPEGFEWLYFRAAVAYIGPDQGPIDLEADFWWALSGDGTAMTWEDAPVCCLAPAFDFTLAVGETREGVLALLVSTGDPAPLIGAGVGPDGAGGIYFAASPDTLTPTNVLFEDDFSSPDSGWQDIYRDETGISDYDQGGFRIHVMEENFDYWANPGLDFADAIVEVEATKIGGPNDNDFGLICRYADGENFYFFLISSDGFFVIGKYTDGEYLLIGSDLMLPTEVILTGEATNRIRVECIGETLRLFVNGVQLAEVTDADHVNGDVGLIAGTFDEPGTDILFDHFAVLAP